MLNSVISAYFYLRVDRLDLYDRSGCRRCPAPSKPGWPVMATVVIAALGTVVLGLWQWPLLQVIAQGVSTLALR